VTTSAADVDVAIGTRLAPLHNGFSDAQCRFSDDALSRRAPLRQAG
jgi:hypothetical protein